MLQDKAYYMRALATQNLLREHGINFWGNNIWPGNSPDLNHAEHIGSVIKDEVETLMHTESGPNNLSERTLKNNLVTVLQNLEKKKNYFNL